jgi:Protein of unknown function (DUF1592)/Protein of unknown function (DUF1588)/Protein of unknown function (DUF1585)
MKTTLSLSLVAFLVTAAGACGGNRLLVGNDPNTGTAGSAGSAGATGSGTAGQSTGTGGGLATGAAGDFNAGAGGGIATGAGGAFSTGTGGGLATGGGGAGVVRVVTPLLIPGETAIERIAQVLWHEAPDADLMLQAAQGHFTSTSDLYGAVHQMLADPRAKVGVGAFYRWWLNLDAVATTPKDPLLFPTYTPALQADMANETETFGVNVTLAMNGSFQTLLAAPFSFINARLADVYGVAGISGDTLRQVQLDPGMRAGFLTQPALQVLGSNAASNAPSKRGMNIDEILLCEQVPAEPAGVPAFVPGGPGVTMRAALAANLSQNATCAACHAQLDPQGLAFETFDPIGRFRTTDNGGTVDVSGLNLMNVLDSTVTVDGPVLLAEVFARSAKAERCMTRQWLAFVLGKTFSDITDAFVDQAHPTFVSSGFNLKELIVAVLTSEIFLSPAPLR